jgi:hypothetical protein
MQHIDTWQSEVPSRESIVLIAKAMTYANSTDLQPCGGSRFRDGITTCATPRHPTRIALWFNLPPFADGRRSTAIVTLDRSEAGEGIVVTTNQQQGGRYEDKSTNP